MHVEDVEEIKDNIEDKEDKDNKEVGACIAFYRCCRLKTWISGSIK